MVQTNATHAEGLLYDSTFTVDSADVIRLMLGYLTSQGLHQSAQTLRQESGIGFAPHSLVSPALPLQVRQGEWGTVLRALQLSQTTTTDAVLGVHEQIILELAERDATLPMAYSMLTLHRDALDQVDDDADADDDAGGDKDRQQSNSNAHKFSKARSLEQRLAAISARSAKYFEGRPERLQLLYGRKGDKQVRRNRLADLWQREGIPLALNRLPALLQQACKWQSFTGQLPWIKQSIQEDTTTTSGSTPTKRRKRKRHLDLVRGVAAGDVQAIVGEALPDQDDDYYLATAGPIPSDITAKVKFGKSAVCEAACFMNAGLITASSDGLVEVWDAGYDELNITDYPYQKESAMGHDQAVLSLTLSNDQTLLASGDTAGKVKIWKLESGKCLRQYQAHDSSVTDLDFSRDGSRLLTASSDGTCREFGLVSQVVLQEYTGHSSYIHTCQYVLQWKSKRGAERDNEGVATQWIVTSSADGTARLWQKGQCLRILQPQASIQSIKLGASIVVDPTGILSESPAIATVVPILNPKNQLLVVPRASTAYLVDFAGTVVQTFSAEENRGTTVFCAASVSSSWVYLCTTDADCLVFRLDTGQLQHTIRDFCIDSTSKTTGSSGLAEVSQLVPHPFKSILAAFSNDKTQKKGVLTVWR